MSTIAQHWPDVLLSLTSYERALYITFASRATTIALLIVLGYLLGEFAARGPFTALLRAGDGVVLRLKKLDKPNRGVATLVYRGMIAVVMLLVPVILVAALFCLPALRPASSILLLLWFGHCLQPWRTLSLLRRAKADGLPLELPGLDYLFKDSHAVLRYLVTQRIHGFTVGVVGGSLWYIVGGPLLMAVYLTLAAAADAYRTLAFGWAARSLFLLMDIIPRFISRLLLTLASLFTPQTKPFAGLFAPTAIGAITTTLDISLGGPTPKGEVPWVGKGTARLTPKHLQRVSVMVLAATLLTILLLLAPQADNFLIFKEMMAH